jgi:methanethiol oxidase
MQWKPDRTFYATAKHAMEAPNEKLAYVALLNPAQERPDAIGVIDVDPTSPTYGSLVGQADMPSPGDELHHFGWNACSSHLCAYAASPHMERRYLVVPGIATSRIAIFDTKQDPRKPELVKVIEGATIAEKTGYTTPHTTHCGPDGIYINALGATDGNGPGGVFMLDHETFDVKGAWESDRGSQYLSYDFGWHLGHDTMITSEWGTPNMVKDGLNPELLLAGKYGNSLHVWDMKKRKHIRKLELGEKEQMVLEVRPARDPSKAYGFAGVVISLEDLSASVFLWYLDGTNGSSEWKTKKVITIPAEPADPELLPPLLKGFGAVPPLVTDLNLSLDDRFLYVSCWGTGELRQYDVSNPFEPVLVGSVRIGGIVGRTSHPARPDQPLNGGPQMVEVSRDGRRVYLTNALFSPWDAQFYPDGIRSWIVKLDVGADGGIAFDERFFVETAPGMRAHQVRLQGGDASSDSFCYS